MLQWLFATLHLLALGCGLGAIAARGRNLADQPDAPAWQRSLRANNWWHLALCLWLASGLPMLGQHPEQLWMAGRLPPWPWPSYWAACCSCRNGAACPCCANAGTPGEGPLASG
jgi:hypothetical protein